MRGPEDPRTQFELHRDVEHAALERKFQTLLDTIQRQQAIQINRHVSLENVERKMLDTMTKMERHLYVMAVELMHLANPDPAAIDLSISLVENIEAGEEGA